MPNTMAAPVSTTTKTISRVLNPIESLTDAQEKAGEDYLSLMRENLDTLRKALDCA